MQKEFYTDIDELPIFNWLKCQRGELKYIHKELKEHPENEKYFELIYDQFLQKRGLSVQYKRILECLRKIAELECDYVITNDRFLLTLIEIEKTKYQQMTKTTGNETSVEKMLIILGKWLGYRLDSKIVTVLEYYNILDEYGKN
jgi:hypothetical protein